MKKIKMLMMKFSKFLPAIALLVGVLASRSACVVYYHQPETPSAMDKYR